MPATRFTKYEEWCRVQYQIAHHDIWWVKGEQMKAGNWTLLLLGALIAVSQILKGQKPALSDGERLALAVMAVLAVVAGSYYVWDLYLTLVQSRERARRIVRVLRHDPHGIFAGAMTNPKRHLGFPVVIVLALNVALGVTLYLLGYRHTELWFWPLEVGLGAICVGYSLWLDIEVTR